MGAALVLSACSGFVQVGYNQAQTLAYFQLDRSFDFDDAQAKRVREDLAKLHAWHRKNELPAYAQWLMQLQKEAQADATGAQICSHLNTARDAYARLLAQAEPSAAALAPTFSAEQIKRVESDFAKRNKEWRKTWIEGGREKQIEARTERLVENAERAYGDLEDAQVELLRSAVSEQKFQSDVTLRENQRRQALGLDVLRQSVATPERAGALVKGYFTQMLISSDAGYRQYSERMRDSSCAIMAKLHNATTAAQRAQAVRVLKGYEADFRALAAQKS
jgi:hypothetical protein